MANFDATLYNTNSNNKLFDPNIDKNNLEDRLFFTLFNKNINYCIDKPVNNEYCRTFYNNAMDKSNKSFLNEYSNALSYVHSNPVNFKYEPFPTVDNIKCLPEYGKQRKKTANARYTFPIYSTHDPYIAQGFPNDINNIKSLKPGMSKIFTNVQTKDNVKFTRINDTMPESYTMEITYSCPDNPYRTAADLDKLWNEKTKCPRPLKDLLPALKTTYDAMQYNPNLNDINSSFDNYNKKNMYKSLNSTNIQNCYGEGKYMPIDATDLVDSSGKVLPGVIISNTLPIGVEFSNAKGSVPVVFSGNYQVWFQDDGNLVLYNNGIAEWHTATFTSGTGVMRMQHDGNLTLTFASGKGDWSTGTHGNPYYAYLYLENNGSINIKNNANSSIIKKIHLSNNPPSPTINDGPSR